MVDLYIPWRHNGKSKIAKVTHQMDIVEDKIGMLVGQDIADRYGFIIDLPRSMFTIMSRGKEQSCNLRLLEAPLISVFRERVNQSALENKIRQLRQQ
jgi:hypothetical protein